MEENKLTSIRPFLTVVDGKKAVEFYMAAFGAREIERFEIGAGKISSVLEIATARFFVADEEPANGNFAPVPGAINSIRMILETRNADALFVSAIESGAKEICPMTTEADWRIGKLTDPFGHTWELGYPL